MHAVPNRLLRAPSTALVRRAVMATALATMALGAAGCELAADLQNWFNEFYNEPIDLRINLESPAREVEVTSKIEMVEAELCSDRQSETCLVVEYIDRDDDDMVSEPPRIPDELPAQVTATDDQGNEIPDPEQCDFTMMPPPMDCPPLVINVDEFLAETGIYDAIDIAQAVPIDLSEEVNVTTPDAIKAVTIEELGLNFTDNELTFDTVPFDLYLTLDHIEDGDAKALIEAGDVTFIGTIERQPGLTDGVANIAFENDDARRLFTDALINLTFTLVFAVPENTVWTLKDAPEREGYKLKPKGMADLSIKATLVYTVTPRELAGKAREAYEDQRDQIAQDGTLEL